MAPVCDSVHRVGVSVPACTTGHITEGVPVQRGLYPGGSLSRGVSVHGGSLSRGISVQRGSLSRGGLFPEGSLSRRDLFPEGGSLSGGLCQGDPQNHVPQTEISPSLCTGMEFYWNAFLLKRS